jgi:hypothetical protein
MKDVELVASLLLLIEEGVSGYSQDELDRSFSDRDAVWEDAEETRQRFRDVIEFLAALAVHPQADPLFKSRLRNQADFYSLFGAVSHGMETGEPFVTEPKDVLAQRVSAFLVDVDDDARRAQNEAATRYLNAARSNSNDVGQRKQRIDTVIDVLRG